jgi:hypothetical protein
MNVSWLRLILVGLLLVSLVLGVLDLYNQQTLAAAITLLGIVIVLIELMDDAKE